MWAVEFEVIASLPLSVPFDAGALYQWTNEKIKSFIALIVLAQ
jgi:hypothetical protein